MEFEYSIIIEQDSNKTTYNFLTEVDVDDILHRYRKKEYNSITVLHNGAPVYGYIKNKKKNMTITSDVIEYLNKHLDVTLKMSDIADELGYTKNQVSASIFNKRHYDMSFRARVDIPSTGLVIYKSYETLVAEAQAKIIGSIEDAQQKTRENTQTTRNMYEQIGMTKTGDLILQDEDGNLFRATELT